MIARSRRAEALMGTIVSIEASPANAASEAAIERAFEWFRQIEARCSRFDSQSELMQLTARTGVAVPVSAILFEAVRFAVAVAEETDGAFDPTIGRDMEAQGFDRDYRTGETVHTELAATDAVSYRDVRLDSGERTITLLRPLILDLGSVAKGLAIDMAARELCECPSFAIDAGGDLYLGGSRPDGAPWTVGIRHPRHDNAVIETIRVTDRAVCTSGDYERRSRHDPRRHHILDPRTGESAGEVASVTIVAATAMLADAVATAVFVLGPRAGVALCERLGVDGVILSPTLERFATRGVSSDAESGQRTAAATR